MAANGWWPRSFKRFSACRSAWAASVISNRGVGRPGPGPRSSRAGGASSPGEECRRDRLEPGRKTLLALDGGDPVGGLLQDLRRTWPGELRELLGELSTVSCAATDGAYNIVDLAMRQLCWAHLKRDFQKWLDRGGEGLADRAGGLDARETNFGYGETSPRMIDRPGCGQNWSQSASNFTWVGGRQAVRGQAGSAVLPNILDVYPALWTFARVEAVEPTNNHAERTLRLAVIWPRSVLAITATPGVASPSVS